MKISDLSKHKQVTLTAPVGGKGVTLIAPVGEKGVTLMAPVGEKGERGNLITTTTERKPNTSNVLDAAKTSTKNLIINDIIITKDVGIYIVKGFSGVNYVVEETEVDLKGLLTDIERSAFVQYQSNSGWAKIAQIRLPANNSQRESITFLVTAEDNTSTTAERYTGILELNTHENAASSALKWLVVSGFGLNNFNLRLNGDRLEVWVLPTVGTISFAVLSETMSGEDVKFIELFDVAESATRRGTSLGYSEKLTIMTNAEIKAAYEANSNTNAYTDADKAKVDSIDLNAMAYFNYAGRVYGDKYSLLVAAWEHSLTVDQSEIERNGNTSNRYGRLQYPNGLTEGVIIPNSVTNIGNYAFRDWQSNIQPLVIPNSVTSIGYEAFYNWLSNNQPLVIPNSVTSIGIGAFRNWAANNHPLIIPNSVTSIGTYAFGSWTNVPYIEIKSEIPPTLSSSNAFDGQNDAPIYVPDGSITAYKNATNWSALASRIFPISDKGIGGGL